MFPIFLFTIIWQINFCVGIRKHFTGDIISLGWGEGVLEILMFVTGEYYWKSNLQFLIYNLKFKFGPGRI